MDDQQPPPPPTHTTDSHPTHITTIHRPIDDPDDNDDHSNQSGTLLGSQASSHNPSPHKRRHTTPSATYVTFTAPIDIDIDTITTTLIHELDSEPSVQREEMMVMMRWMVRGEGWVSSMKITLWSISFG